MTAEKLIELRLTARERELVRLWIENMREDAGHWGDGAVEFPEERRVEDKLKRPVPAFTRFQLELILDWAEPSVISNEERELVRRIGRALGKDS